MWMVRGGVTFLLGAMFGFLVTPYSEHFMPIWRNVAPILNCDFDQQLLRVNELRSDIEALSELPANQSLVSELEDLEQSFRSTLTEAADCGSEDAQITWVIHVCEGAYGFERNAVEARRIASEFEARNGYGGGASPFSGLCPY